MSRQKQKGTAYESGLVKCFRFLLGDTEGTIHREVLHGSRDIGDITGVRIHGEPLVIEVKNYSNYSGHLKGWMDEARTEAGNADTPYWVVIFKEKGLGITSIESLKRQPALTDVKTLARIAGDGSVQEIDSDLADEPVLTDVEGIALMAGHGIIQVVAEEEQ